MLPLGFREICNSDMRDNFREQYHLFICYLRMCVSGGHAGIFKRRMSMLSLGAGQYYHSMLDCDSNKLWQLPIIMMS